MDTTCFRGTARFPPRAQPNSFSIDWILSSGHRKPGLGGPCAYTQPHVLVRGAFCPSGANRPLAAAASFGPACVYTPHFYHRHSAAYRNTPVRLQDEHHAGGEFGLKTCRRMRTVFSPEQLQKLEEVFAKQRYMTGSDKVVLASALRLTETQVKVWFQNRRTKWRKSRQVEGRPKNQCSDLKHQTSIREEGEFKPGDSDESPEM